MEEGYGGEQISGLGPYLGRFAEEAVWVYRTARIPEASCQHLLGCVRRFGNIIVHCVREMIVIGLSAMFAPM